MRNSWNVGLLSSIVMSVFTVGLVILLIVGSFQSAIRSNRSISDIDRIHFPILEELAVGSRLQQSMELLLELSIESRDPKYIGEYELARGVLAETLERVNKMTELNQNTLAGVPYIDRVNLFKTERKMIELMHRGQFEEAASFRSSEAYLAGKNAFLEQMFLTVQIVTEKRNSDLVKQQQILNREYMLGLIIVGLVSFLLIVIFVLWFHASRRSRKLEWLAENNARLAALGEMAGGVAHEINNPLAIIEGVVELCLKEIERGVANEESLFRRMTKIRTTIKRITNIVKSLKRFSREPENDEMRDYFLIQAIEESLDLSREKLKQLGVELQIDIRDDIKINCNLTEFSQVILNLVNNSIDEIKHVNDPWIKIVGRTVGRKTILSIIDSGPGIPKEIVKEIMRPFFTTKAVGQGTGLGLSISHGIIKRHGGDIIVDQDHENTKFDIVLPQTHSAREVA